MSADSLCAIDLGTCNSTIAVYLHEQIQCIAESVSNTIIPSIVAFNSGDIACGSAAKAQSFGSSTQVYREVKFIKGRQFKDIKNYRRSCWPFELLGKSGVKPEDDNTFPQMISFGIDENRKRSIVGYAYPALVDALLLSYMTSIASRRVGTKITKAVITVPALFTESQIYSTLEAAEMAGLEVIQIVPEPCAAAIRYTEHSFHYVLIFDFGGGTLDTTLMEYRKGQFRILSTHGNIDLGGRRIDQLILNRICEFAESQGGFIDKTSRTYQRLLNEAEIMKIRLSSVNEVMINFGEYFTTDNGEPLRYEYTLRREMLNEWIGGLLSQCIEACESCLEKEHVTLGREDAIVLTGGSSHIPAIYDLLKDKYKDVSIRRGVNPQTVVAEGACMMALHAIQLRVPIVPDFSLGLNTMYTAIYSFGKQANVLVRDDTLHTVITHCQIQVPSGEKYMFLWQIVEDEDKPVYIGYVDVGDVSGREWRVDVSFTKQSLMELKDVDKNEVVRIQYACRIPKQDREKFRVLNGFLCNVRKAISRLESLDDYPQKEKVLSRLKQLREIAAKYMFKNLGEEHYEYINREMIPRLEEYHELYE